MNPMPADTTRRTVAANGTWARIIVSFLATAGLFYVNIMPAIVDGLINGLQFSSRSAGLVGSANVYGAAAGALLVVFTINRIAWRKAALALLVTLIGMDMVSMLIVDPATMIGTRFLHGIAGGALVGIGFAVIARISNPDRTFGVLLVVQFGLGGLGNLYLPRLVPLLGTDVLFLSLVAFSLATLAMLAFLGPYPAATKAYSATGDPSQRIAAGPLALTLLAIFLFQASNMGLFAFIIGLGRDAGLSVEFISLTLALSGWIGIVGAAIVIVMYTRFGRTLPLTVAMVLTAAGFWALHYSDNEGLFLFANCGMGITWAFVIPYLLGLAAEFDRTGQMAALGGFASKMGLASGPMLFGVLLGENDNYALMINVGIVILVFSLLACLLPSLRQDRIARVPTAAG